MHIISILLKRISPLYICKNGANRLHMFNFFVILFKIDTIIRSDLDEKIRFGIKNIDCHGAWGGRWYYT